jgi:lipopolysaccharide/colanic/teichoic acid biosynthesis glycosyltransferase
MLIQLPSGSPDQPGSQNAEQPHASFEAGLRRDLASAPIVSYDALLGGPAKRVADLTLAIVATPLWLPLLLAAATWSKLRHRSPVFCTSERIGYGGRSFKCFSLRIAPPVKKDELNSDFAAPAANDLSAIADHAETRRAKWRRALERLPQMLNVISGDMALVGPSPLTREQLEPLKSARRYYLSARPGMVGISTLIGSEDPSQYKIYAMSWALSTDALILWDAIRSLRDRGELWKPSFTRARPGQSTSGVIVRRRSAG